MTIATNTSIREKPVSVFDCCRQLKIVYRTWLRTWLKILLTVEVCAQTLDWHFEAAGYEPPTLAAVLAQLTDT